MGRWRGPEGREEDGGYSTREVSSLFGEDVSFFRQSVVPSLTRFFFVDRAKRHCRPPLRLFLLEEFLFSQRVQRSVPSFDYELVTILVGRFRRLTSDSDASHVVEVGAVRTFLSYAFIFRSPDGIMFSWFFFFE